MMLFTYQKKRLGTTYLFFMNDELVSYLTLTMCSIKAELMPSEDKVHDVVVKEYPVIRIARLAVDEQYERRGFGTDLLLFAFGKACDFSQEIGCRFLIVDAKPEAVSFYEQNGFKLFKKQDTRRYPTLYFDCLHLLSV